MFAPYRAQQFGPDLDNASTSSCQPPVSLVFIGTDRPVTDPRKCYQQRDVIDDASQIFPFARLRGAEYGH